MAQKKFTSAKEARKTSDTKTSDSDEIPTREARKTSDTKTSDSDEIPSYPESERQNT
jgi:hypothetical protein